MTLAVAFAKGGIEGDGTAGITNGGIVLLEPGNSEDDVVSGRSNVETDLFFVVGNAEN